ncbi:class I SAM-dependent methyltransferase [Francisella adeliensis]|uniref:SAM-dependent methyltransferase n=1 Tax=Francisella adeliensis TaxID=2007306 RepID=A0A2Z4XYX3_9GAMM|nr:class I SAM-dependent methyltransferase [Francisella adeliensis]AXA33682.1 SAM-dependent methyltransferase [Francisella adeliensis]MBK2085574.1 class I SAM-dependent methyltransferase [Francisella adeliensis]MBK2097452.1 class I SAM-dependent methyltransferase [Francisella adeliensis]QIW11915.1 class I SAM-dependent methyltransferase [Francisella adeliensis]QIW13791.1 class I SAM-dependent methyltransferase [Francisella adeliensis]
MEKQIWNAEHYNSTGSFVTNYGDDVVNLLQPNQNETILDLGCGTGRLTSDISKKAKKVYGVDYSQAMIDSARKNFEDIEFSVADAQLNLDYPDQTFDAVFSNAALHWMMDAESVIKNIHKVLKLNGRFVFEMGGNGNIKEVLASIDKVSQSYQLKDYHLQNFYPSLSQYSSLLEKNGFEVRYALLFNRPTLLEGKNGLANWVSTFRSNLLDQISNKDAFLKEVQNVAKTKLYKNGKWYADYVRLRMIAYKVS